ncbi:endoplasmic reticulum protein, partial [Punctularia strigosozonata HHB-11173 SS5]|uniref:endoplasmic reticulum protein n=1 Tax=Punctularia strigosozonata (strain HHB-11173) TaxID=741275 RepID=UPI0004416507
IATAIAPRIVQTARWNSTQSPASGTADAAAKAAKAARKAALDARDELQKDWTASVVTYEEVKAMSESPRIDAYLIDVREPDEVRQGSIPSAVNLPLSSLASALALDKATFKERFGFNKPGTKQEVTFYCRSGKRSASAADVAKRNGYTNLRNYSGSWLDWVSKEGSKGTSS